MRWKRDKERVNLGTTSRPGPDLPLELLSPTTETPSYLTSVYIVDLRQNRDSVGFPGLTLRQT